MKRNCEACKQWTDLPDFDKGYLGKGWGVCDLADGGCEPEHPTTLAFAVDYEGISAWLATHATLWCSQWEGKV